MNNGGKAIRSRGWCFTAYEPNLEDRWLTDVAPTYWCYGDEVCPSTKRRHWQGYLHFGQAKTMAAVKSKCPKGIHFEARKGTCDQAIKYCEKDGVFKEDGDRPAGQGNRTDIRAMYEAAKQGSVDHDLMDAYTTTYAKYPKFVSQLIARFTPARTWQTQVYVYWGPTGTGKSRFAFDHGASPVYIDKSGFAHGYNNQKRIVFDDFKDDTLSRERFLQLMDRYPCFINVKGGSMNWNPEVVYITSNYDPANWYGGNAAVQRRITKIRHFATISIYHKLLDAALAQEADKENADPLRSEDTYLEQSIDNDNSRDASVAANLALLPTCGTCQMQPCVCLGCNPYVLT